MKKTLKQITSLLITIAIIAMTAVVAFAADITAADAEKIALNHAKLTEDQVKMARTEIDYDNKVKIFEVEFYFDNGDGTYTEYDYEVRASDGEILKSKKELEIAKLPDFTAANDIGIEKAKENALAAFGLDASQVSLVKAFKENDDGRVIYEIEYRKGFDEEYSCEVDAETGLVFDMDIDANESFFDKIELLFEILENWFKMLFAK